MSDQVDQAQAIRLAITPEATDEEVAAIAAVVTALIASAGDGEAVREPVPDRWALAGRQEALRGPLRQTGNMPNVRD